MRRSINRRVIIDLAKNVDDDQRLVRPNIMFTDGDFRPLATLLPLLRPRIDLCVASLATDEAGVGTALLRVFTLTHVGIGRDGFSSLQSSLS